jgi:hypothetical protein
MQILLSTLRRTVVSAGEDGLDVVTLLLSFCRAGAAIALLLLANETACSTCSSSFASGEGSMTQLCEVSLHYIL